MFKLSRKEKAVRLFVFGSMVIAFTFVAAFFIIKYKDNSQVNAASEVGDNVTITRPRGINYGDGGNTGYYLVKIGNKTHRAYCVQPKAINPAGRGKVDAINDVTNSERKNNLMKLIIYIREKTKNESAIKKGIFRHWVPNMDDNDLIYAWTHAILGVIYGNDWTAIPNSDRNYINGVIEDLEGYINDNAEVWQLAQRYNLYISKSNGRTLDGKEVQDVVWIESNEWTGDLTVSKCDSETTLCVPQGNASFEGIVITVYNASGRAIYNQADSTFYEDGEAIASGALDGNGTVFFQDLPAGENVRYKVVETVGNASYVLPDPPTEIYIDMETDNQSASAIFYNTVRRGGFTVGKIDKDTGSCTNAGGLGFAGTSFELVNESVNGVRYNGVDYARGAVMATKTLAAGECSFSFDQLPYGTYTLRETAASPGYALDSTPKVINIPTNDAFYFEIPPFENQPIRGDITFTKKDTNNNTPMANAVFEISSITANYTENHIVVADANGVVDTRDSVNPHTNNTNGYDELYYASETPIAYANYGTWFGKDMNGNPIPARNGVGALPYGTYLIQELKCDTNMFCTHLNNEKKTFTISENNQVVNLNDAGSDSWGNDCAEFSLSTTATDNADGDHYLEADSETVIKDVVAYCAKKNYTFTIKGILMDKATNQPLMVNGNTIEQSVEISPDTEDCGTVEMLFPVDSSELAGKSIVVFEKLYYKNEEKASHEDINDENQTVVVVSLGTVAVDNEDEDKIIIPGEETVIKDTVSYCAMAGKPFTITGVLMDKTTGQPILVDGQPVTQKVSFTSEQDCGTVEMIFPAIDTTVIAGHPIVVFETLNKVIPGEPEEKITSHEDIDDEDQTVYPISISTTVQPNEDGTKIFPHDEEVTITDMVHYCLQPGLEYTVKGIVMDKSTGNGILVDSQTIEQSVTFTPTEACGEFPMYYTFNTKDLSGAKLVIFESLYYNDKLLIEHKDIENELESFEIDIETPDTGFVTKNEIIGGGSSHQEFLIIGVIAMIPVGIYAFSRYQARKRFYNR